MAPYEPYQRGERVPNPHGDFSDIERVANQPGFFAKRLRFHSSYLPEFKTLEELTKFIEERIDVIKPYIAEYLPEYYIAYSGLKDDDMSNKEAYIFIKEVEQTEAQGQELEESAKQIDNFIERAAECFIANYDPQTNTALAPDLKVPNFVHGKIGDRRPQTYYVDLFPVLQWDITSYAVQIQLLKSHFGYIYDFPKARNAIKQLRNLNPTLLNNINQLEQ